MTRGMYVWGLRLITGSQVIAISVYVVIEQYVETWTHLV